MRVKRIKKNYFFSKQLKCDSSKNISSNFSGTIVGIAGSVQRQIVPCSGLYFFLRSVGAP